MQVCSIDLKVRICFIYLHIFLLRYVQQTKSDEDILLLYNQQSGRQPLLSKEDEKPFVKFIDEQSQGYHGLTLRDVRHKAYTYATHLKRKVYGKHLASYNWLRSFRIRNELMKRKPQLISLARARAMSRYNTDRFYRQLKYLFDTYNFPPARIYNVDETGVTTVPPPRSFVLAHKNTKKVQHIATAERGTLITVVLGMSAAGNLIPPGIIYPRKGQSELKETLPQEYEMFYTKNGWMNGETFFKYMEHFIKNTKPSAASPVLLLYDNHASHLALPVIELAQQNHVHILTIIPHSSHVLQPLDVGFNKGFKQYYSDFLYTWMRANQDEPFVLKQCVQIIKMAFEKCKLNTFIGPNSFRKCGIYPLDPHALDEHIRATDKGTTKNTSNFFMEEPTFAAAIPASHNKLKSAQILTSLPSLTQNLSNLTIDEPVVTKDGLNPIKLTIRKDKNGTYKAILQ